MVRLLVCELVKFYINLKISQYALRKLVIRKVEHENSQPCLVHSTDTRKLHISGFMKAILLCQLLTRMKTKVHTKNKSYNHITLTV